MTMTAQFGCRHGRLRDTCETCEAEGRAEEWHQEAVRLGRELAQLRDTVKRLNRRVTIAEGVVMSRVKDAGGANLGRALANAACSALRAENAELRSKLAAPEPKG